MADPFPRNDWIGTREDKWTDILPQSWQSAINTNPMVNALARYMQRPSFEQGVKEWQDNIPGNSPIDRIAEGRSTLAREYPKPMSPFATEALDKAGFLANFIGPGGVKLPPPAAPKPQGIKAYHGSPHDFDRFDLSKIGTGEGAQAYGRGLYFAENEGVARSYRDALTQKKQFRVSTHDATPDDVIARHMANASNPIARQIYGDPVQRSIKTIDNEIAGFRPSLSERLFDRRMVEISNDRIERLQEARRRLVAGDFKHDYGRMYEVRINADPEKFLDWDKPLSQQPESVRKAIPNADLAQTGERAYRAMAERQRAGQRTGDPFEDVLLDIPITDHKAASQALREAGIPGIKYKDAMSRGTEAGTSNYVVFDAALIDILRKYGLLPPMAAGGALMGGSSEAGASPGP